MQALQHLTLILQSQPLGSPPSRDVADVAVHHGGVAGSVAVADELHLTPAAVRRLQHQVVVAQVALVLQCVEQLQHPLLVVEEAQFPQLLAQQLGWCQLQQLTDGGVGLEDAAAVGCQDEDAVLGRFKQAPIALLTGDQGPPAPGFGDRPEDGGAEFVQLVLEHIIHRSLAQGAQGCGFGNGARDKQERHFRGQLLGNLQGPCAGELRQGPVRQDRFRQLLAEGSTERGFGIDGQDGRIQAGIPQGIADQLPILGRIFDHQQEHRWDGGGRQRAHWVVPGSLLSNIQYSPSSATDLMNASDSTGLTR